MTSVFISYSRKDIAFARLLHKALQEQDLETWIDWQDIPPSVDWLAEVYEAIEKSDAFVFVISETSLESEICNLEITHAVNHGKRIIPIVINDVTENNARKELAELNWIFFDEPGDQFSAAIEDLITAITVDQEWVKAHTRYEVRALAWEKKGNDEDLLLRGGDLREAENWITRSTGKNPQPTPLQTQYIVESRKNEAKEFEITKIRAEKYRRRAVYLSVALLLTIGMAITAVIFRNQAIDQRNSANLRSLRAENHLLALEARNLINSNPQVGLLLAIEAMYRSEDLSKEYQFSSLGTLLTLLNSTIDATAIAGHEGMITDIDFSPNGDLFATGGDDGRVLIWDNLGQTSPLNTISDDHVKDFDARVAFSPDGEWLASIVSKDSLILYNVRAKNTIRLRIDIESGYDVVFSPNSKYLAIRGPKGTFQLWFLDDQNHISVSIEPNEGSIFSIEFSPTNDLITLHKYDDEMDWGGKIIFWDPSLLISESTESKIYEFESDNLMKGMAISPDGKWLAAAQWNGSTDPPGGYTVVWDLDNPNKDPIYLPGHGVTTDILSFSPNSQWLATVSTPFMHEFWDPDIWLWDMTKIDQNDVDPIVLQGHQGAIRTILFSPDSRWLASGSGKYYGYGIGDKTIRLWDTMNPGSDPVVLYGQGGDIVDMVFSPDGNYLISGGTKATLRKWTVENPGINHVLPIGIHQSDVSAFAFIDDGSNLIIGDEKGNISIIKMSNSNIQQENIYQGSRSIEDIDVNEDESLVAYVSGGSRIILQDLNSVSHIEELDFTEFESLDNICFSGDGRWLAFSSDDVVGFLDLTEIHTDPIKITTDHAVRELQCSDQNNIVVARLSNSINFIDSNLFVWALENGSINEYQLKRWYETEPGDSRYVGFTFDPFSEYLLAWTEYSPSSLRSKPTDIYALSFENRMSEYSITTLENISTAAYSQDGDWLAFGIENGKINLYMTHDINAFFDRNDIVENESSRYAYDHNRKINIFNTLIGHEDVVRYLSFTPDGDMLISAGDDFSVHLWNLLSNSGESISLSTNLSVDRMVVGSSGEWLTVLDDQHQIHLWPLKPEILISIACEYVGRDLTQEEWDSYFPNEPFQQTCGLSIVNDLD